MNSVRLCETSVIAFIFASIHLMIASRLSEAAIPKITPNRVPVTPMRKPSMMKISMIEMGLAPIDFSTPIAFLFSITTITSVPMMVNPAEMMTRNRMIVMISFSSRSA